MNTRSTTDFSQAIFYAYTSHFEKTGEVTETTLAAFLRDFVEDPAAAWVIKENDGKFEVRMNAHNQYQPSKLFGTFDTEAEAEQFMLEGLNWDFCNKDFNGPSYDFDRAALVEFLNEATSA